MYKNLALLLPDYPFDSEFVAGITQSCKGNYLDFTVHRPEGMKGYMLQLTTFGKGVVSNGQETFEVQRGQLLLFAPNTIQHYYRHAESQDWHYKWIYFSPNPQWDKWLNWTKSSQHIGKILISEPRYFQEISQLFTKVEQELRSSHFFREDIASTLLAYLLMKCSTVEKMEAIPSIDQRILTVCELILSDLAKTHSIEFLAENVYLSASRLSHLFKQSLGISLVQWRELQRISEAKKRLYFSNLSISNIAKSLGYEDSLYFSKIFRKHTGTSPSLFRERERSKNG